MQYCCGGEAETSPVPANRDSYTGNHTAHRSVTYFRSSKLIVATLDDANYNLATCDALVFLFEDAGTVVTFCSETGKNGNSPILQEQMQQNVMLRVKWTHL